MQENCSSGFTDFSLLEIQTLGLAKPTHWPKSEHCSWSHLQIRTKNWTLLAKDPKCWDRECNFYWPPPPDPALSFRNPPLITIMILFSGSRFCGIWCTTKQRQYSSGLPWLYYVPYYQKGNVLNSVHYWNSAYMQHRPSACLTGLKVTHASVE